MTHRDYLRIIIFIVSILSLSISIPTMAQSTLNVSSNDEWEEIFSKEFDGVEMVLVPSGCFMMGFNETNADEMPVHQVCMSEPFYIDRYEVTNQQAQQLGAFEVKSRFRGNERPVDSVSWVDAQTYCLARGGRLPTESEWEYAARGPDGLLYPWGISFRENAAVFSSNANVETKTVGLYPDGTSWVGAYDMAGNVWEWTSSIYQPYPYTSDAEGDDPTALRVLRGGSANNFVNDITSVNRFKRTPTSGYALIGFRCMLPYDDVIIVPTAEPSGMGMMANLFDGVEMMYIPAGCFMAGSEGGNPDELPIHNICFESAFWMDRFEVTNSQYRSPGTFSDFNNPRETISWAEAREYCESRGGRLPTEMEWEYAARGNDSVLFSWGDDMDFDKPIYGSSSTQEVGSHSGDVSSFGVEDMMGNVSEWTSSIYESYPYDANDGREDYSDSVNRRTFRGGNWRSPLPIAAPDRDRLEPSEARDTIGFRCVRDFASGDPQP